MSFVYKTLLCAVLLLLVVAPNVEGKIPIPLQTPSPSSVGENALTLFFSGRKSKRTVKRSVRRSSKVEPFHFFWNFDDRRVGRLGGGLQHKASLCVFREYHLGQCDVHWRPR